MNIKAYHGSWHERIDEDGGFNMDNVGRRNDYGYFGYGIYFTPNMSLASYYGPVIYSVEINPSNPYVTYTNSASEFSDEVGGKSNDMRPRQLTEILKTKGHDCVLKLSNFNNSISEICVFDPGIIQILSKEDLRLKKPLNESHSELASILDELKGLYQNQLVGGIGDKTNPDDVDQDQLLRGIIVEFEHTGDPLLSMEIAIDHLTEIPDYYDWLEEMEENAKNSEIIAFESEFYPPYYPPKKQEDLSNREKTIFSIMSMYKAMNDRHKKEFNKWVPIVAKWKLEEFDDNYLMRLKMNAEHLRDVEKDVLASEKRYAKAHRVSKKEGKELSAIEDYYKEQSRREREEHAKDVEFWKAVGMMDEDGNFIK